MKINKEGNKTTEIISYKVKFIDSMRFMATSLSNLVNNLTRRIHKLKCEISGCFLEYRSVEGKSIKYNCSSFNKHFLIKLNEELKKKFRNTFEFSKIIINKFILLLRKEIYPYKYMDDWEKFSEKELPEKEKFSRNLNLENITDENYIPAKRFYRDFEIKNLGEYHDLYLRSDVILLTDVFESFRKMCLEINELGPVKFVLAPGLAWEAVLKMAQVELDLITDIDMLLMIEKGIREICNAMHHYAKANNKYMTDYDKTKEP